MPLRNLKFNAPLLCALVAGLTPLIPLLISFFPPYCIQHPVSDLDVKDWNDRAELYEGPFTPLQETLVFSATQSSMIESHGFTLALFSSPTSPTFNPIPCLISECT